MSYNAYRKTYGFLSSDRAEKYSLFLKENIYKLKPKFYAIVGKKRITTKDGIMYALHITPDVECPDYDVIVECWINGSDIYLWRDKCWGIAVDAKGKEIKKKMIKQNNIIDTLQTSQTKAISKSVLLFLIG